MNIGTHSGVAMLDKRQIDDGQLHDTMNWCHMCGKWSEAGRPAYLCPVCIDDWSAAYDARAQQRTPADEV
jgi:hypothetical protein